MPNLIGTGNNQVPTNGMLGGLAYQSPDNAVIKNLELTNLSGHNSLIPSNAVDVFVYDTRKDSDGGAWRKRTQHTSWYNETLNTATRGSRRDFPAVAVIVLESNGVMTIYDADDPDMPMWIKFVGTGSSSWNQGVLPTFNGYTAITALNGIIAVATTNESFGFIKINFISDNTYIHTNSGTYGGQDVLPLSQRNSSGHTFFSGSGSLPSSSLIFNNNINDVAMTVLPNAPIDSATGLPVPTIAIACGLSTSTGAVSVINDNGTVSTITPGSSVTFYTIRWIDNTRLYAGSIHISGVIGFRHYILNYPSLTTERIEGHSYDDTGLNWSTGLITGLGGGIFGNRFATIKDGFAIGYGEVYSGLNLINYDSVTNGGMFAYIKSNYNTGWMHGDIKGAWLSDTSTASVTGTELVTNGTFATSTLTSYTQLYNCSLSVVSNQLRVTSTAASGYAEFYVNISDTTKYHYFSFQFVGASGITQFGIYAGSTGYITDTNAGWTSPSYTITRSAGTYTLLIPPGNAIVGFVFNLNSLGQTWTFDNISLKPVQELDRSLNNRGLAVYGTITKTPVATGSNLVSYGNFGASNYLFQPYNSALDFGTGNFCYMCWVRDDSVSAGAVIFQRGAAVNGNETVLYIQSDMRLIGRVQTNSGVTSNICFIEGQWNFVVFQRRGSTIEIYHNGILQGSTTNTETTTQVGQGLSIGAWLTNNSYFPTSISLFRVSATAPSPEQILKIYNDEKALFQPNSQCTLFGSSDAVTALAYDDTTRLLSVGTSSGRSDFQGLERINNTTTAVTTAISASNGLIAEQ